MSAPKPFGSNWVVWGNRLTQYLDTVRSALVWRRGETKAPEDGILLWDNDSKEPVVSIDGVYRPLVIQDGSGMAYSNTNITAAAADTAYEIEWDGIANADGVTLENDTEIHFNDGGLYSLAFSVQITSGNSSLKDLWFWPAINGTDVQGSTMRISIDMNGGTVVMSRTALFTISAGDYLEAKWATSDTGVTLEAHAAEPFAPATPSVTLSVARIHQ
jgi:hypothetical protein